MPSNRPENPLATARVTSQSCKTACAPSPTGCLRCESIPCSGEGSPTLLLGPLDADAGNALRETLAGATIDFSTVGPTILITQVRDRLTQVAALLKSQLSSTAQSSIAAAYVPGGLNTPEQIMSALLTARPLAQVLTTLEHEWVRDALAHQWLFSMFHPIIHAATGELFAQEALIRAKHPETGQIINPGQIIGACEKLNLQHQLDQRARQCAIRGAAQHVSNEAKVFINFLPNTIYDPAVCLRTTMDAAAESGVPMSRLVFEVVETEKIPDMDRLLGILDYYRSRGCATAIDDMGAGHTSLEYITALTPDFVKLDREFVLTALAETDGRRQMETVIRTCQRQNAKVIAEGIETEAQMQFCIDAGVDFLQGFLFAKPACPPQAVRYPAACASTV
jgi:EAL domain-containing protein (putative c-di-GMP-specific phosphodiesterase class I)